MVIVLFVAAAILAPLIAPYDPIATSWSAIRKAPSAAHWMGTDENGRDVLSRVLFGARASLLAGVVSVVIAAGIGVPAGLLAGFAGGWIDAVLSRIVDAMLACPFLILAIALTAFLGPDLTNAMIAIGVSTAPRFMRVARAATLEVGSADYVQAAWSLGARGLRVAVRHIAPNIVPPMLVQATPVAGRRHHRRGVAVVPWPRAAAAVAVLGIDAERRAAVPDPGAMAGGLPRGGDLPVRAVVQPGGRRPARRARPARTLSEITIQPLIGYRPSPGV